MRLGLLVHHRGVLLEPFVASLAHGALQSRRSSAGYTCGLPCPPRCAADGGRWTASVVSVARPSGSNPWSWRNATPSLISSRPIPPTRDGRMVKYLLTSSVPTANRISARSGKTAWLRCPSWTPRGRRRSPRRDVVRIRRVRSLSSRSLSISSSTHSSAKYGLTARAPYPNSGAKWCTSRGSAVSRTTDTAVRFCVRTRCCSSADTARSDGIATWFSSTPRSERMRIFAPFL